jgi:hypothetical protein
LMRISQSSFHDLVSRIQSLVFFSVLFFFSNVSRTHKFLFLSRTSSSDCSLMILSLFDLSSESFTSQGASEEHASLMMPHSCLKHLTSTSLPDPSSSSLMVLLLQNNIILYSSLKISVMKDLHVVLL